MRTAPRQSGRSSWPSSQAEASRLLPFAAALLAAGAAQAQGEVRGRLTGERATPGIIYAADMPESVAPAQAHATLRQLHLHFLPQVLAIVQGTTVDFVNEDATAHNVFSPSAPDAFDLGNFGDGVRSHTFRTPGARVILCNVHLEMVAWILVLRTASFATADPDGRFELKLPPGPHRLVLWRPREPERAREVEVPAEGKPLELEWDLAGRAP